MPTIKARIGGTWVPVGGGGVDEVWIGTAAPTDTATELWYDTDEPNLYEPDTARWNTAWGIIAVGTFAVSQGASWTAGTTLTNPLTVTLVIGRRYRINCVARAVSSTSSVAFSLQLQDNGVAQSDDEWCQVVGSVGYNRSKMESIRTGDGASHTFNVKVLGASGMVGFPTFFYVEDIGPVSLASSPPAQPSSVWTNVTFQNGWANAGGWQPMQYRLVGDVVQVRGHMVGGTASQAAFTLPVGYRPVSWPFIIYAGVTANVGVTFSPSDGTVTPNASAHISIYSQFSVTA